MPKISVVIPVYNKVFTLKNTLKSALNQTFTDFEIIVVNDGSTDGSFEILSQFSDNKIHIYQQKNKGAAAARNLGIKKSTGELIAFLDADDYWFSNHLEELFKLYKDFPNCGLYGSRYFMKISNSKIIQTNYSNCVSNDFRGILPNYFLASKDYRVGLTSAIAIPKYIFTENFLFNTEISSGQDLELYTRIAVERKTAVTNLFTVEYNFSLDQQLSKTPIDKKKLMDFSKFNIEETLNKNLKSFLDIYRLEYALQYKIIGDTKKSNFYLKDITNKIPVKIRILLSTPSFILKTLLTVKHILKKYGIDFSVYN